jgi:hypothetical protein
MTPAFAGRLMMGTAFTRITELAISLERVLFFIKI